MTKKHGLLLLTLTLIGTTSLLASGPSFQPDTKMDGTTLKGWHPYGQADWRTEKGEIIGVPKAGAGGWLVLDHSYQDSALYTEYRCTSGCGTGVAFSAGKTRHGAAPAGA